MIVEDICSHVVSILNVKIQFYETLPGNNRKKRKNIDRLIEKYSISVTHTSELFITTLGWE